MARRAGGTGSFPAPVSRYICSSWSWNSPSNSSWRWSQRKPNSLRFWPTRLRTRTSRADKVTGGFQRGSVMVGLRDAQDHDLGALSNRAAKRSESINNSN